MKCPNCNNPYFRHKGKKTVETDLTKPSELGVKQYTAKVKWSGKGYYCKRCGYENSSKR